MRSIVALLMLCLPVAVAGQARPAPPAVRMVASPRLAPLPAAAVARAASIRRRTPPRTLALVDRLAAERTPPAQVRPRLGAALPALGESDIDALVLLVMMRLASDADADLRATLADIQAVNAHKQALRHAGGGRVAGNDDSLGEMSEMESLRLQMAMERRSKFVEALSNTLEKIDQTQEQVVHNLK